ncbi:MAG TPA: cation:dicarboxylase symporter family transporter [Candidatus Thermoplasmatota archaeon]|nr:cation:dicarboxylase symporter family transporter [Candidatus Thermoplasmatota archaeon]
MLLATVRKLGPLVGLFALLAGIALGSAFPSYLAWVGAGVDGAFWLLGRAVPFIIFLVLTPAIVGLLSTGSAGKFAFWVSVAFVLTTFLAGVFAAIFLVLVFGLPLTPSSGDLGAVLAHVGQQTLAAATGAPAFIAIWYGALVALFLHYGGRSPRLAWFCRPTAGTLHRIGIGGIERIGHGVRAVLPGLLFLVGIYIPTKLADALSRVGEVGSLAGRDPVLWYFLSVGVLAVALAIFLAMGVLAVCRITGFSVRAFVREYLVYVYPFAWATASSYATVPINLDRTKALGVRQEIREFIVVLGATVNLDGTMIGAFVLTVTTSLLVGYTPTALDILVLILPLAIVSIGAPGIPGGMALIAPGIVLAILPIPVALHAAFFAIFVAYAFGLSDQFRTGVNATDNGLLCLLFEHWYPAHFAKPGEAAAGSFQAASAVAPPAR